MGDVIKRWEPIVIWLSGEPGADTSLDDDGDYVLYTDHAARVAELTQRAERAEAEARGLREVLGEARDYVAAEAKAEAAMNTHRSPARHHEQQFLAKIDAALKGTP